MRPSIVHRVVLLRTGRNSLEVRKRMLPGLEEAQEQGYRLAGFWGRGLRLCAAVVEKEITVKEARGCGS